MKRWAILAAAAVALAVAIFLVPKGGGSALAEAGERLEGQSMRMRLNMTLTVDDKSVTMHGDMVASADGKRATMDVLLATDQLLVPETIPMDMRIIGDDVFVRSPSFKGVLPPGKTWLRTVEQTSAPQPMTPRQFAHYLTQTGDVEVVDQDAIVRGKSTTHYKGTIDVNDVVDEIGGPTEEWFENRGGDQEMRFPLEAWVGRDGLPVRVAVTYEDSRGDSFKITNDVLGYGVPVDVERPPASATIDEAELSDSPLA